MLSKKISTSKKFAVVGSAAGEFPQLLYTLLMPHCDDFGRQPGDAFTVKHEVFPTSPRSEDEFESALVALEVSGLIQRYAVDGQQVIQIVKFETHQQGLHKRTGSEFPEPPPTVPGSSGNPPEIPSELKRTEQKGTEQNGTAAAPRQRTQGRGAFEAGGLQRDHMHHACCGANRKVCFGYEHFAKLQASWGGTKEESSAAIKDFADHVERFVGDGPLGNGLWMAQLFDSFKAERGRVAATPPVVAAPVNGHAAAVQVGKAKQAQVVDQLMKTGRAS